MLYSHQYGTTINKCANKYIIADVEQTCEKVYQTPSGTYQSHIAIRISKKEIARKTSDALSADDKLETLFNRDQFRKWAEEYMKGYEASK